jgi:hypothetical protein
MMVVRTLPALALAALAGCVGMLPTAPATPPPEQIQAQQRAAFAQSINYPTRKSPQELAATIEAQTKGFRRIAAGDATGQLAQPAAYQISAERNTCYTVVLRLGDGAAWGPGAEAGLRFDFQTPTTRGSGGPGVVGPGAVASVGCPTATGPVTLTMAPMIGADAIGHGPYTVELWSHRQSDAEAAHMAADQQRQADEQRAFAERQRAKEEAQTQSGCATCDGRYQGCIGAGLSRDRCESEFRTCAFEKAGPRYMSTCASPRN